MLKVVHVRHHDFDTYIGRASGGFPESKWANPFIIGIHGTRDEVVAKYEIWIRGQKELMAALPELRGKTLGCWCHPFENCHGKVLDKLLQEVDNENRMSILPVFTSHYSLGESILTLEEAGKTEAGNPVSICDIAKGNALKQVVLVESRIDGFLEAYKNFSKPYKPNPVRPISDYIKDPIHAAWTPEPESRLTDDELQKERVARAESSHADDTRRYNEQMGRYEKDKKGEWPQTQLIYGVKLCVCDDVSAKDDASLRNESNVVIFVRNSQGYNDLIKIWNRAWTDGFYYQGRTDWKTIKEFWTPNLSLAIPFFSGFIAKNTLTLASIVPTFPVPANEVCLFREVGSGLPFVPLIEEAMTQFATSSGAQVQDTKSIYYEKAADFPVYQTFRAIHNRAEYAAPGVDHLASNQFSFEAWKELTK